MAKKIQLKNPSSGEKYYPTTSSACVGMADGSGSLDKHLSKITTEYNVSVFHPSKGSGNSNRYTLATAIVQVPEELRVAGLVVSFLNGSNKVEKWEYQGGAWAVASFKKPSGGGGNMILPYKTDVATTRKQVQESERVPGMQISYKGVSGWVNEQFIGSAVTDAEWAKDGNWEQVANAKMVNQINDKIQSMETNGNALAGDVGEGKKIVAKAITQKGVLTSPTASYQEMADNIGKISTGQLDTMFRIEIDFTNPSPEVKRFGSAEFPNWLESATRGVMLKGGKVNYELDRDTFLKKKDKTNSVIDGSDGDVMSQPPVFWVLPTLTASNLTFHMTNIPQTSKGWIKLPAIMYGASRAVREKRSDGKFYLRSCYNTSPSFRGGNNQEKWDNLPGSLLGMPCSQINVSQLREYARNNGVQDSGWYHNWAFMPWFKLMLLFMAIRGTRDWQAAWPGIDPKTGDEYRDEQGFKYGGLGPGVINFSNYWSKYNGQNPIVRADFCYDMGTRSGVKKLEVNVGSSDAVQIVELQVPCFLGISEPSHGDALLIPDGIRRECLNIDGVLTSRFHIFANPERFTDSTSVAADLVIDTPNQGTGWVEQVNEWLIPVKVNPRGNSTSHFCDQVEISTSLGNWGWYMGGHASYGSQAGGWCAASLYGLGLASSHDGGRLCFTPSSDGAENP